LKWCSVAEISNQQLAILLEPLVLDILVIAPHSDDAEIGMGGSIALSLADGYRVGILDLTDGEPTPHGSIERRQQEAAAASRVLGVAWRRCLGLPNRSLEHTLDARWSLASVLREVRPKIVFAPYWEDAHPDHVAATQLIEAARFWAKLTKTDMPGEPHWAEHIYYYFSVHLRVPERPSFVLDISQHLETKLRAVECFESQFGGGSSGGQRDIIEELRTRARYWGWAIGTVYGEPFVSRVAVGLTGLRWLAQTVGS
jgi:bacillithiol biosynthesis deacetylase BshB1